MNRNSIYYSIGGLLIIASIILLINFWQNKKQVPPAPLQQQINEEAGVQIIVEPLNVSAKSPTWDFKISLNTHYVEITQDLAAVSSLTVDRVSKKPIKWEGGTIGHHRTGILSFSVSGKKLKNMELKIRDIGGVPERIFAWQLP